MRNIHRIKWNEKTKLNRKGFSLVEGMLTVVLFSFIFGACITILISGTNYWSMGDTQVKLEQEIRKAMEWMKNDLLEAGASKITNVPANGTWYNTITFQTSNGVSSGAIVWDSNTINYALGGTDGTQIVRTYNSGTKVLANHISSMQFRRQSTSSQVLEVALTALKTTNNNRQLTQTLNFEVVLRND